LAAAKAGRGSKKVHTLVALSKFHTRNRLSETNSGSNATAGGTKGTGVGVGVLVGTGAGPESRTVNKTMAVMPPALTEMVALPVGMLGTRMLMSKLPTAFVLGAGKGRTWAGLTVRDVTGAKGAKFLPATVIVAPGEPIAGIGSRYAAGIEWLAVEEAGLSKTMAVTVLVDGISAVTGTSKVVVKAPAPSGVTMPSAVPA